MRPDEKARGVASGTFVDAGNLALAVTNNVLSFGVGGLTVTADLASRLPRA